MTLHEASFRAMDTDIDLIIAAAARPVAAFTSVADLFARQEARFSRFRDDSALSQLNRGRPVADRRFVAGCRLALRAEAATGGLFNPMILPALEAAGYGQTFAAVRSGNPGPRATPSAVESLIFVDDAVVLRQGRLDLGGIVKGWTVDRAVELLGQWGYRDVLVNAGGDVRCSGQEPGSAGWQLGIDAPGGQACWQGLVTGALATSTTLKRRWPADRGGQAHHLIDPRTGMPANSPFAQVSVWAGECWDAEVWAKAVLIGGEAALERAADAGYAVLALDANGIARRQGD